MVNNSQINEYLKVKGYHSTKYRTALLQNKLAELQHHHHFTCNKCESVSHITINTDLTPIQNQLENENMFKITNHTLKFYGICRNCQR